MLSAFAGGRLFGERRHSGSPAAVVALHGWGRSRHDFAGVLGQLQVPSVALDLPGFGASPPPPAPWGSAEYASAVAVACEELLAERSSEAAGGGDGRRLVLLGHSFGGDVAVRLAATRPELVAALVLSGVPRLVAGAPASRRTPPLAYRVVRGLNKAGLLSGARLDLARRRYGSADYRAAEGVMREVLVRVLGEDLSMLVGQLGCPAWLVWGELDTAVPRGDAEEIVRHLPVATLTVVPGVGHHVELEAPGALAAAVASALAGDSLLA